MSRYKRLACELQQEGKRMCLSQFNFTSDDELEHHSLDRERGVSYAATVCDRQADSSDDNPEWKSSEDESQVSNRPTSRAESIASNDEDTCTDGYDRDGVEFIAAASSDEDEHDLQNDSIDSAFCDSRRRIKWGADRIKDLIDLAEQWKSEWASLNTAFYAKVFNEIGMAKSTAYRYLQQYRIGDETAYRCRGRPQLFREQEFRTLDILLELLEKLYFDLSLDDIRELVCLVRMCISQCNYRCL